MQHCPNRGVGWLKIIAAILAEGPGARSGAPLRRLSRVHPQRHIAALTALKDEETLAEPSMLHTEALASQAKAQAAHARRSVRVP